jgi:hypothetical protein
MSKQDVKPAPGLTLSEAIGLLRDELLRALAVGADSDIQLPVESMTVELNVAATRLADGKSVFTVVDVQPSGGSLERPVEHRVTVVFRAPVDIGGRPVKVAGIEDWDRLKR